MTGSAACAPAMSLQALIDLAARPHGQSATVMLAATNSGQPWLIDAPVRLPAGLRLQGPPGGVLIRAANDTGQAERRRPALIIGDVRDAAVTDVVVQHLRLEGRFAGPPIRIHNAARVQIADGEIIGSRAGGIAADTVDHLAIHDMVMRFARDPSPPTSIPHEGGAGIWCFACNDSRVAHNTLDATPFWQPGPPWDSGDPAICLPGKARPVCRFTRDGDHLARALDLIAFYGGARNTIEGNNLTHGNAAGIYINQCARPNATAPAHATDFQIRGNQISFMRQHGIDIVGAERPVLQDNRIAHVGGAGIALASTIGADIIGNVIAFPAESWHSPAGARQTAAIKLLWGTRATHLGANDIDKGDAALVVYQH